VRVYMNLNASKPLDQLTDDDKPVLFAKPGCIHGDELTLLTGNQCVRILESNNRDILLTSRNKPHVRQGPSGNWLIDIPDRVYEDPMPERGTHESLTAKPIQW